MEKLASTIKDRYSKHNISEFHGNTASQFHSFIEFEIDDEDRLGLIFSKHGKISMVSVFYQLISMLILAEGTTGKIYFQLVSSRSKCILRTELTNDHYADIGLMLGFIPVESAEVPKMLKDIANDIYLHGKSDEFETISSNEGMEWLEMNCISAARLVNEFLRKHGHRSIKEVNFYFKFVENSETRTIVHEDEPTHLHLDKIKIHLGQLN